MMKLSRVSKTERVVYYFICNHPGMSTYEISKELDMTGGRVRHALAKLEDEGMIKFKFDKRNPRTKKLTYPVDAWRLLPRRLRWEVKKFVRARIRSR